MSSLSIPPPNNENFVWPEFDAPEFKAPDPFSYAEYDAPQPFAYDDFQVPTADQARMDPGYEFGRTEGLRALTNRASASGSARTGGTMKDLIKWGNSYADQNYGNVFNRNLQTYSTNRDNAFDTWGANELARARTYDTNRNNAADAYATNYGVTRDTFDRNYTSALDEFKPKQQAARDTFDDLYRRWQAELNATAGVAGFGAA